jgi:predicted metal-binding protein
MPATVFVCTTCDRNAPRTASAGSAGQSLSAALRAAIDADPGTDLNVREVACLNGCLHPCNIGFRGAGRYTYRFSKLGPADLPAVLEFSASYWQSPEGGVAPDRLPPGLSAKLSVHTPPRGRW